MADGTRDILWQPASARGAWMRYGAAACVVLAVVAGAVAARRADPGQLASEVDDAVLLDLPPALASSTPPSEAANGPEQPAMEAAAAVATPEQAAQPPVASAAKPDETPQDRPPDDQPARDQPVPNPPELPPPAAHEAAIPLPPDEPKPPAQARPFALPPVVAAPAQEERAPAGSRVPVPRAEPVDSDAARRRAARAINRWQQAMLARLEVAKSGIRAGGQSGTATLAFAIDRRGRLLTSRIARSSGSPHLDQAALDLLARAAPFPEPPAGFRDEALQFTVPVAFARR